MPKELINDETAGGFHAEVSWCKANEEGSTAPGHVQLASVNLQSPFEFPAVETDTTDQPAVPFDGWRVTLSESGLNQLMAALRRAKKQAFPSAYGDEPVQVTINVAPSNDESIDDFVRQASAALNRCNRME